MASKTLKREKNKRLALSEFIDRVYAMKALKANLKASFLRITIVGIIEISTDYANQARVTGIDFVPQ